MKNKAIQEKVFTFFGMLSPYGEVFPGFLPAVLAYFRKFEKWEESRGAHNALLRAKHVQHACLNAMLGQKDPEYSFLATRKGWPVCALGLRKYSKTPEGRRAVLTALSFYRGLIVPGLPDFDSITREGIPVSPIYDRIASLVKPTKLLDRPEYHFTSKQGPNGPALQSATLDALALKRDPELDNSVKELLKLQGCDLIVQDLLMTQMMVKDEGPAIHSRLSLKQEPGAKVRIFAICDYYSQVALRPLHKAVARILSRIPQDFTWNQEGIVNWLEDRRKEGVKSFWSLDLSSATDRFPAILQKKVVAKLIGESFSEVWYDLMTKRDFYLGKTKLRYSTGQPMGAYSSWPVFAFSHHMVVRYCAKQLKMSNPKYAIVGDDIVIADQKLAYKYYNTITKLGVQISMQKSLTGNCLEFCKRIWDDSQEITPIPAKLLLQSSSDYRTLIQLNEWLCTRGVPDRIRDRLLESLLPSNERKRRLILIALTVPTSRYRWAGAPVRENWRWPPLPSHIFSEVVRDAKINNLSKVYKGMIRILSSWAYAQEGKPIIGVPGLSAGDLGFLPTEQVINKLGKLAETTHELMNDFIDSEYKSLDEALPKVKTFDPQVLKPDYRSSKLKEMSFLSSVHETCSQVIKDQVYIPVPLDLCDVNAEAKALHQVHGMARTTLSLDQLSSDDEGWFM